MTPTLTQPDVLWQIEIEDRAEVAVAKIRARRVAAALPPRSHAIPRSQLFGMAFACFLIGALVAAALLMSLNMH